jgi:carboxyl-terminal processing protease
MVCAGILASVTTHGQAPLPDADTVVARYVQAIGGRDALKALSSLHVTGAIELREQNLRGTFEMLTARPARALLRVDMGGIGKLETGYNGDVGWTLDPMAGPSLMTGAPLAEMKVDAHFDAALHPSDIVVAMSTTAKVTFDGREAYQVTVRYVSGQPREEYFDVDTGLLLGTEAISETDMGKMPVRTLMRDYKAFGTIKQPTHLVQSSMGMDQHFLVESIKANTLAADVFDPPAVIRAMIKDPAGDRDQSQPAWKRDALASFDDTWITIRDSFHDPSFGGLDWTGVRDELRPKVIAATGPDQARDAIRQMLARLERSHFGLMSASGTPGERPATGDALVPIDVRLIDGRVVISSVKADAATTRSGLAPGQVVLAIDDEQPADWMRSTDDLDPRARALRVWQRVQRALRGPDGSRARIRVRDGAADRDVTVTRVRPTGERIVLGDLPPFFVEVRDERTETPSGKPVGVIGFNVWMPSANNALAAAVERHRDTSGLVIDLRGNPGGLAAMIRGVAGHFVSEPVVLGRMQTRETELTFSANPRVVLPDGRRVTPFAGPVAILVDELTASASECFAGGLQSLGRVRVFGRTSAGQALPASTKRLANGDLLMYAVGDFVTGSGRRLEGVGVVPDEPVQLDPDDLRRGVDPDLEAALRWFDEAPAVPFAISRGLLLSSSDLHERLMFLRFEV